MFFVLDSSCLFRVQFCGGLSAILWWNCLQFCGAGMLAIRVDCFEFDCDTVSIQESDQNASNNTTNNRSPLPCPNYGKCFAGRMRPSGTLKRVAVKH